MNAAEEKRFTLDDEEIEILDFVVTNSDELSFAEVEAIDKMAVGEEKTLGGGASADFILKRVA